MGARMKLVLFDIDGTMLRSAGVGRRAMEGALVAVFGSTGHTEYRYDGKTDRQIVRELMRGEGWSDAEIDARLPALVEHYLARLTVELAACNGAVRLLPGVADLLDALDAEDDRVNGLLTGNLAPGASRKLAAAGVDFERFRVGAFGSDHEDRGALPALAQVRARERLGIDFPGEAVVIIGDTPADIECGRRVGARAIAVATGRYSVDDLAAHGPAAVLEDLADLPRVLRAIDDA